MGFMMRVRNWELRLIEAIRAELEKPFDWDGSNCGDLIATAIRAVLGNHPVLEQRMAGTEVEVRAYLKGKGGFTGILGKHFQAIPATWAQDGDVALLNDDTAAVVLNGVLVGKTTEKAYRLPISKATTIYRIA